MPRMKPATALLAACLAPLATDAAEITHGPLLGLPTPTSINVWARTATPGDFHVRYGTSPDALDTTSPPASTSLAHDNTATATLTGLEPGTRYYYRLASGGVGLCLGLLCHALQVVGNLERSLGGLRGVCGCEEPDLEEASAVRDHGRRSPPAAGGP